MSTPRPGGHPIEAVWAPYLSNRIWHEGGARGQQQNQHDKNPRSAALPGEKMR
jgi:hypothetical protein